MNKNQLIVTTLILAAICRTAVAQEKTKSDTEFDAITSKYEAEYQKLQAAGQKLAEDAPKGAENTVGVDVDLSKWHDVSFDVPEFKLKQRNMSFDVPQVTMKSRRISWDVPETKMERRKVGQKPEFHGFTVRWTNIYMDVPTVTMKRKDARLHIPEVKMERVNVRAGVPEITGMRRVSFKVPDIKVRSTDSATDTMESGADNIEKTAKTFTEAQEAEIKVLAKKQLLASRSEVDTQYKSTVAQIATATKAAKDSGADPSKLKSDDGTETNLIDLLAETTKQFEAALKEIDKALEELDKPAESSAA